MVRRSGPGLPIFRAAGSVFRITGFQPVVAVRRDDRSYSTDLKERSAKCGKPKDASLLPISVESD